ncbi:metallophosphoesterase [uncultured Enorma sp.]|uniref:metallophosphoesterase n=1 Tax=uncultured Enorma sp. TaxID=1714346 RepID=UPI00262E2521|nr:metallophosphoesterase [uncultured Enorma sp.]
MAIYVLSDVHGHKAALDEALGLASPGDSDAIYVLGDMVDRGPEPLGVIQLVRSLPNTHVLMGNHERMLVDILRETGDMDSFTWALNGGVATALGLDALDKDELAELVDWVEALPLFDVVDTATRRYILVHAGIDALEARAFLATAGIDVFDGRGAAEASREDLLNMLAHQDPETLLWTREGFWGCPTGLVGADGTGPVVVAGHTPSIVLARYAELKQDMCVDAEGRGCVVPVGACDDTGGVADRIDIDCSAAAGAPRGRVGIVRLDDGATWYASIKDGE